MLLKKNIGVLLPLQLGYARGILRGFTRFAVPAQPWILYPYEDLDLTPTVLRQFKAYNLAGAIAYLGTPQSLDAALELAIPLVNVASVHDRPEVPRIGVDDVEIGRLTAEHFLERKYRNFAFFGNLGSAFTRLRLQGYRSAIEARGFTVLLPPEDLPPPWSWNVADRRLHKWLLSLPRPLGIFGYTDSTARLFASICRDLGLHIPEEIALVGVDNDRHICDMSYPPLSSVEQPLEQIGYRAAELLCQLMAGSAAPAGPVLLPPVGVVTRQSSDIIAIHDAEVASAMQFIRENAERPIRVEDILDHVPINRRSLEKRFRAHIGHTILAEINRTHIERAKRLLLNTGMPISEIAERSGFNSPTRFGIVFAKLTGLTPNRFRKTFSTE